MYLNMDSLAATTCKGRLKQGGKAQSLARQTSRGKANNTARMGYVLDLLASSPAEWHSAAAQSFEVCTPRTMHPTEPIPCHVTPLTTMDTTATFSCHGLFPDRRHARSHQANTVASPAASGLGSPSIQTRTMIASTSRDGLWHSSLKLFPPTTSIKYIFL
jgi:hypothetical protein